MGGKSKQETVSQGGTAPWYPAQAPLQQILGNISGQIGNYQPNSLETGAINQLTSNAQNQPNYGPQVNNLASSYLGGDPTGLLSPALAQYQAQLNPIANQNNDPTKTPGIMSLLDTIRGDVSNSVNGMFAGAGRDLSGLNTQTLARGIAQGEAAPLLNQYNQNVAAQTGAAGNLFNAAGNTANALVGNQSQGLNLASAAPQFQNQGPLGVLSSQQLGRSLPLQNLGMLENLTVPIAGLGNQTWNQSVGYNTPGPMQTALGWSQAFGNLLGGQFSPTSNFLGAFKGLGGS